MQSHASFVFDGEHNKNSIINILETRLKGFKYKFEEGTNGIRIYVGSLESKYETFNACLLINSNTVYDFCREL